MNKFDKPLSKEEENILSPDEKRLYRTWKREEAEKKEQILREKKKLLAAKEKTQVTFNSKEEYLELFTSLDLTEDQLEIILMGYYTEIYSVRKMYGLLGKEQCDEFSDYFEQNKSFYSYLFEAMFEFFDYKTYQAILEKVLIEGLKFPIKNVRLICYAFLKLQIEKDNIRLLFWRELLEKKYVSGRTWEALVNYFPIAVEKGIEKDIYHAIKAFVDNPDKKNCDTKQMTEKWQELGINPLKTYNV